MTLLFRLGKSAFGEVPTRSEGVPSGKGSFGSEGMALPKGMALPRSLCDTLTERLLHKLGVVVLPEGPLRVAKPPLKGKNDLLTLF